jgi:hypothetical protein
MSDADPNVEDALRLFEFFESKGFQDKQQMMTLVTWLTPVVFALIAYCWTQFASGWMPLQGCSTLFI